MAILKFLFLYAFCLDDYINKIYIIAALSFPCSMKSCRKKFVFKLTLILKCFGDFMSFNLFLYRYKKWVYTIEKISSILNFIFSIWFQ